MGDGRVHENGAQSDLAGKVLWALFALLLMGSVAVVSYFAGHSAQDEPMSSNREALANARQIPALSPPTLPQPASPPPSEMEAPPPVARMLEEQSRTATAVAEQGVEKQSVTPATKEGRSPPSAQFSPPDRVRVARRAIGRRAPVEPRRVRYASRVVEVGNYRNRRLAQAAHARLVRVYPYVKTLPKTIMSIGAPTGKARAFHLRLTTGSPEHARILCQNLLSIGRGCAVLPEPT